MFSYGKLVIAGLCLACAPAPASLLFTTVYNPSVLANFGATNTALLTSAITYAESQFSSNFSDNIHVNITVNGVAGTGTLGSSSTSIVSTSYAALLAAMTSDKTTPDDTTALGAGGSVTAADPVAGSHTWWVASAQAKALGLAVDSLTNDGSITFGAGFSYTFDPSNRAVPGEFDFIGVAEHEISEVMGRFGLCGSTATDGKPDYTPLDEFSFTGAGARGLGNGGGNSFSINDGTTPLIGFNNQASNGGDCRDWAGGGNDAFNAFNSSGVQNDLTAIDVRELDAIGYDAASVPEPSTGLVVACVLLIGFFVRRRAAARVT